MGDPGHSSSAEAAFPEGFLWGAATSAYQIEGGVEDGGRGQSIWDTFSHTPGKTRHGETGDVACEHHRRFRQDVALMADLGIGAYRFSIAWPRVQPDGAGPANHPGLDFYRRLVEELRAKDILPVATLYHWDLPQALEDQGGWTSRETALRFGEYAALTAEALSDGVGMWITLNEPWVAAWLGYGTGIHAPGKTHVAAAVAASHHLLLAHGLGVEALRSAGAGQVGIALDLLPLLAAPGSTEDATAMAVADAHRNRFFLEAVMGRGYPAELMAHFGRTTNLGFVLEGDMQAMARPIDFLGVNYYRRETVAARPHPEHGGERVPGIDAWTFPPPGVPATAMGWAIEPHGLRDLLIDLHRQYPDLHLYVTENGAAFDDHVDPEGEVDDLERIDYLTGHIGAAREAIVAGVPLRGYFVWSLMDNFEWSEGYSKRFGLVFVDFDTQRRTPKRSAAWYRRVVATGGRSLVRPSGEDI